MKNPPTYKSVPFTARAKTCPAWLPPLWVIPVPSADQLVPFPRAMLFALTPPIVVNEPADMSLYEMSPPANVPIVEVDERGVPREGGVK